MTRKLPSFLACVLTLGGILAGVSSSCTCGAEPIDVVQVSVRAAPRSLAFGGVPVGARATRTLTLVNDGSTSWAPDVLPRVAGEGGPFVIVTPCALPLDPGDFCEMSLAFQPAAEGAAEGALEVAVPAQKNGAAASDTLRVPLSGTGTTASVVVSPPDLAFGDVLTGASARLDVHVQNDGSEDLVLPLTITGGGFLMDGAATSTVAVAAGAGEDVSVAFVPARGGPFNGELVVEVCGPGCGPAVALSGSGLAPRIEVQPRAVDFATISVGDQAAAEIVVTNVGAGALGITQARLVSPSGDLTVDAAALPLALDAGSSVTLVVRFSPTVPRAELGASLLLTSSDPVSPQVTVPIAGSAPGPGLELLPAAVHFGVLDNTEQRSAGLVVRAIGTEPVDVTDVRVTGSAFSLALPPTLGVLEPGDALLFDVVAYADSTVVAAGGATGTVIVSADNLPDTTAALQFLSGEHGCQPRGPTGNTDLGGVPVGQGLTGVIPIHNVGDGPCALDSIAPAAGLPFDPAWSYSGVRAASIAPGATGIVDVGFSPTDIGTRSAFLRLTFDGALAPLLVSATGAGVLGNLQGEPGLLALGPTPVGCAARPRPATFINRGGASVNVVSIALDDPLSPFRPSVPVLPDLLLPGASQTVDVGAAAQSSPGVFLSALTARADNGLQAQVRLQLTVVAAGVPVEESFIVGDVSAVDVLFVVDNSGSMQDDQQILADNFNLFISSAFTAGNDVDFHLGVTTTDVLTGLGGRLVDHHLSRGSGNLADAFATQALVGVDGSGTELGLEAMRRAIEVYANAENAGFLRAEAALSVVVVTDEEDSAVDAAQEDPSLLRTPESYVESLRAAKGGNIANTPVLFSVVGSPGSMPRYETVAASFNGVFLNIGLPTWGSDLSDLGAATFGLQRRFQLGAVPEPGSVVVTVDGVPVSFTVDGNAVTLDEAPPAGSVVDVAYQVGCS